MSTDSKIKEDVTPPSEHKHTEDAVKPGKEAPEKPDVEDDIKTINANNSPLNNGHIGIQKVIYNYAETLARRDILITPYSKYFSETSWKKYYQQYDTTDLENSLTSLLEKQILFIASDNFHLTIPLAHYIYTHPQINLTACNEIYFEKDNVKHKFGLNELIGKLTDDKDLFIFGVLSGYHTVEAQKRFLDSLTQPLHTDNIEILRQNRIFIVILITQKTAREIVTNKEEHIQHFQIWDFDEVDESQSEIPDPAVFFDKCNYVEKILLYTATFFNGLPFRSFNKVMDLLLSETSNTDPVAIEQYKDFPEGAKIVRQIIKAEAKDIWHTYKNQFFKNCYLIGKEEGGIQVVDFIYSGLRDKLWKYFKEREHYFWQEQFDIIDGSSLVFEDDERLVERVLELMVDALADDPTYYNENWFWDQCRKIIDFENSAIQINEESPEAAFLAYVAFRMKEDKATFYYKRFGQILSYMVNKKMDQKVKNILQKIAEKNQSFLIKTIEQLETEGSDFDAFYWVKLIFDNTPTQDVYDNTYGWLLNMILSKSLEADVTNVWTAVRSWIPLGTKDAKPPFSAKVAAVYVVDLYIIEISYLPLTKYGTWPAVYSLFRNMKDDPQQCKEHISFVARQFFEEATSSQFSLVSSYDIGVIIKRMLALSSHENKHVEAIIRRTFEEFPFTPSYEILLADIVETWYHIVKGWEIDYTTTMREINAFVISTVMTASENKPGYKSRMINQWDKKPGVYKRILTVAKTYQDENDYLLSDEDREVIRDFTESVIQRRNNLQVFLEELIVYL